jgi:hypothetical protein
MRCFPVLLSTITRTTDTPAAAKSVESVLSLMPRLAACALMAVSLAAAQTAWRYVPAKPDRLIAMEWRKVLESPYSAQLRAELPADAASALRGLNIIEGIERLIVATQNAGTLIVLEGSFDRLALKGLAASEGAVVKPYKSVELVLPAEPEEDDVVMALVSGKHLLLGYESTLRRAIDRAEKARALNRAAGFDLWISDRGAETGWRIGDTLTVHRNGVEEPAVAKPKEQDRSPEKPGDSQGKIRIYGLDEGVREIPLEKPKR